MLGQNKVSVFGCEHCGDELYHEYSSSRDGLFTFLLRCPACNGVTFHYERNGAGRVHGDSLALERAIHAVFADIEGSMTVRQVYYRLTALGAIPKTEAGYNKVQRRLTHMRRVGSIPYHWLTDASRAAYAVTRYHDKFSALDEMQRYYRRDLWQSQNVHVELWLEKRALEAQLHPVCDEFGVRLYPMGGFSSISFAALAASQLRELDKPIFIYHLSDFDADGLFSSVALERELREEHGLKFGFERLVITQAQISQYGLHDALRPQKRSSPRASWYFNTYGKGTPNCEMDALHPRDLRAIVRDAITRHIDAYEWQRQRAIEKAERDSLRMVVQRMRAA